MSFLYTGVELQRWSYIMCFVTCPMHSLISHTAYFHFTWCVEKKVREGEKEKERERDRQREKLRTRVYACVCFIFPEGKGSFRWLAGAASGWKLCWFAAAVEFDRWGCIWGKGLVKGGAEAQNRSLLWGNRHSLERSSPAAIDVFLMNPSIFQCDAV